MSVQIIHARGGDPTYTPGDQTGHEVDTGVWYNGGWGFVLRFKSREKAALAVKFARAAAANPHIGYGQGDRNTLRIQAQVAGWDASKINRTCNCDCSSFVAVCAEAGGVTMEPAYVYGNAPWTGNMKERYQLTGDFVVLEGTAYTTTDAELMEGDILVSPTHTVIVAGPGIGSRRKTVSELAEEVLAGEWGNDPERRTLLMNAGYDYAAVQNAVNELVKARDAAAAEKEDRLTALEKKMKELEKNQRVIWDYSPYHAYMRGEKMSYCGRIYAAKASGNLNIPGVSPEQWEAVEECNGDACPIPEQVLR